MADWWLTIVTFLPLAGAIVIGFAPVRWARQLALGTALATWVVSLLVAANLHADAAGFQMVERMSWIPAFGIQYKLGVDGLSLALVVLTTTLTWISILASCGPIQVRVKEYMISFLILEVGLIGVFLALDTFLFYIFWEIVLVPMYLVIGIWGGANRIYATIKFVLYTLVGSLLMLVSILATAYAYAFFHFGAIVALVQPDLKRLVAYHSVSHMGFVTLGIFVFNQHGLQGAILQMVNHGLITGALFLCVGIIYERTHDRTIAKMGGLAARTPVWAAVFGFFVFASAGLPGLSGFVGEFLVLLGTFEANPAAAAVAVLRLILAARYFLWLDWRAVFCEGAGILEHIPAPPAGKNP